MYPLELLAAGGLATDTTDVATVTLSFSEPGEIDLDRLVICMAADGTAVGNQVENLLNVANITSMELNGSEILVRGRNTPASPASIFSVLRPSNFVGLGKRRVSSSDTLAITLDASDYAGTVDFSATACVPMFPDRFRGKTLLRLPAGNEVIQASPLTAISAKTATALTITCDASGFVDLSRLAVQISIPGTSNLNSNEGAIADTWANLAQLAVRSDYNIVIGQGTPVAPLVSTGHRLRNWFNPGIHKVSAGDSITVTVREESATAGFGSAMVPLVPVADGGGTC
jgi:hypothetical protein